jgi:hypothetical protein
MDELKSVLPKDTLEILSRFILKLSIKDIQSNFDETQINESIEIDIQKHLLFNGFFNDKIDVIKNVGFDFPLNFHNNKKRNLVIVALDPKRSDNNKINQGNVSLGSVFALHNPSKRQTVKNDYWNFIYPLTQQFNIYLTDVFKVYFELEDKSENKKGIHKKYKELPLNNNSEENFHHVILKKEIECFFNSSNSEENIVLTLGKEARNAVSILYQIEHKEDEVFVKKNDVKFIFMPHISRTVTQNIKTVGRLYEAIGELKDARKIDGNQFKLVGSKIKELQQELFS